MFAFEIENQWDVNTNGIVQAQYGEGHNCVLDSVKRVKGSIEVENDKRRRKIDCQDNYSY